MRRGAVVIAALLALLAWQGRADAQEALVVQGQEEPSALSFGVRIGGYGFRQLAQDSVHWTDCRMDGAGLFGAMALGEHLFTELSLDFYGASAILVGDLSDMDRVSAHGQGALGLKMPTGTPLVPYAQLGLGAEWTRVVLPDGRQGQGWYPSGFLGVGAEWELGDHLSLGSALRVVAMAHPVHGGGEQGHSHGGQGQGVKMEMAPAGQMLFLMRYAL